MVKTIFSLGAVLYRLTTGREPFTAKNALSTLMAIATETPPSPQLEKADLPAELSDLIMKLLEKEPAERHGSQEVAEELAQIERQTHGESVTAKPASRKRVVETAEIIETPPPKPKANNKRTWLIMGVVVLAVLSCIAVPLASVAAWLFLK